MINRSCDYVALALPGVQRLQPYQPGKPIEELQRELGLEQVVKLASNENPLGASPKAIKALQDNVQEIARYPDGNAYRLKRAIAERCAVEMSQITLGNGSNDLLELIGRAYLSPEHSAVYSQYSFAVYPLVVQATGAQHKQVPTSAWGHDLNAMAQAIDETTRVVFIANPNNPTGTWVGLQPLLDFMARVPRQVLVVLDEAYAEYVDELAYPNGPELLASYPNLIVTRTFSKVYGLANLRIGFALSHPEVADILNRVRQPFNANGFAQTAALAALEDHDFVELSVRVNQAGMQQIEEALQSFDLDFIPSLGNFIAFEVGDQAEAVYQKLLRAGIIVRPVANYDMPRHLRVSIGTEAENQLFIDAMQRILSA